MNKYPLEIEFTDYCGLKCESCVNPFLGEKGFLSAQNYYLIIDYIFANKDKILYINFSGIGDMFLHPNIHDFLEYFIQKFRDTDIHVLIPTKGQSLQDSHIPLLQKMQDSGIHLNISIGMYSLRKKIYNYFSGSQTFDATILCMKKFKKAGIQFSLELLKNRFSLQEKDLFHRLLKNLEIGGEFHHYHNFGGMISQSESSLLGDESCHFDATGYKIPGMYCSFIPFISQNGDVYTCSVSGKNKNFLVGNMSLLFQKFPNYLDLVQEIQKNVLSPKRCFNCSIYQAYEKETLDGNGHDKSV